MRPSEGYALRQYFLGYEKVDYPEMNIKNIKEFFSKIKRAIQARAVTFFYPSLLIAIAKNQILKFRIKNYPNIAIVKQDVYQDLYCCSPYSSNSEIVFSSLKRTGPVSLFTKLDADFWIVKTESDPECNIWKEKVFDCKQKPIEHYESLVIEPFMQGARGHKHGQGFYSVFVHSIDWEKYDIVISLDVSVPSRITSRFPQVVWCYYIGEPCMNSYRKSKNSPVSGYDLFLNQNFRFYPQKMAAHEVEFPYFIQNYNCFQELLGNIPDQKRQGIIIESHTQRILDDEQLSELSRFGSVYLTIGKTQDVVESLLQSKYFLRIGGRKLRGNAMIEAISAGCLAIGNPEEFLHESLFTPNTRVKDFKEAIEKIAFFETHPNALNRELMAQRQLVDYLCFYRPLSDLLMKAKRIKQNRVER